MNAARLLLRAALVGALVAVAIFGLVVWTCASWDECRRVHPAWYCAAGR